MANFGKQKVSSKQVPNLGQKKSIFSQSKFPESTENATATSATTDLSEYRKPQPGEMIANVMQSSSTSRSSLPPNYVTDNQLTAPKRQQREINFSPVHQLKAPPRQSNPSEPTTKPIQKQEDSIPNQTGLPDNLKAGVENLSGYSLDNVRVHYNSPKPPQLQALAYTQGKDIHVAPGQEKHLPHEAWHVVQQMQGRVKPTMQMKGLGVNDDSSLEHEADVKGKKASLLGSTKKNATNFDRLDNSKVHTNNSTFSRTSVSATEPANGSLTLQRQKNTALSTEKHPNARKKNPENRKFWKLPPSYELGEVPPATMWRIPNSEVRPGKYGAVIEDRGKLQKAIRASSSGDYLFSKSGAGTKPLVLIGAKKAIKDFLRDNSEKGIKNEIAELPEIYMNISYYQAGQQYRALFPVEESFQNITENLVTGVGAEAIGEKFAPQGTESEIGSLLNSQPLGHIVETITSLVGPAVDLKGLLKSKDTNDKLKNIFGSEQSSTPQLICVTFHYLPGNGTKIKTGRISFKDILPIVEKQLPRM
ncbi:MAG: DUF4157 domain-containing protein [Cyanobacteriota bacterium]|nr:DUF4157 domain-containing protein [Cyanobacteriota bacterium]